MKKLLMFAVVLMFAMSSFGQVAYLQYRVVPADREAEFVEKETKYWSKVAKAAIDQGKMAGWSLWRKVGVTEEGAPNYVFVNTFESFEKVNLGEVWSADNLKSMGVSPEMVETNSFTKVPFDYWMQLEDMVEGDYKYALVNYAMPKSLSAFIQENKELWKPLHEKNIKSGNLGMKSWGLMSVVYPTGKLARFSVLTWDGFDKMSDAMNYLRYDPEGMDASFQEVISKSKMGEIMPEGGFEYSILYELVDRIEANE
ncbi:hypothetical protein [Allomuricauda sp. SCSIO 65647]|uniref:hypothetical protein n=1 Tax=Allomuricauda sp. SCSIO 65647 TaxID=2908843 RepID=UPI001F44A289|nr:hypothetical protein [Muricauda sp. SCSIO 65647]UJH66032.1 hypothetical protein L0P89_08585 [Muricauda sp. SCSIO 65647]